jgi:hypothetical protein
VGLLFTRGPVINFYTFAAPHSFIHGSGGVLTNKTRRNKRTGASSYSHGLKTVLGMSKSGYSGRQLVAKIVAWGI